ncbi:hypothetical protein J4410_02085 [Candidatus Woesearchaeota archaeon]|nr:hypothetical protein [Candidatus Woesearchaeota archaeon]
MNKKAFPMVGFILGVILLLVGFGLVVSVYIIAFPEKIESVFHSEKCRISNEINYDLSVAGKKLLPTACETGDLVDLPLKEEGTLEDVKKDIAEALVYCWYDWLEGRDKDLFGKLIEQSGNKCFVCKHFGIRTTDSIKLTDQITAETLYRYVDTTLFTAYVPKDERNPEANNACEKKGGRCFNPGEKPRGMQSINKWKCDNVGQTCYVKEEYMITYKDYLEGASEGGGFGYLALLPPPQGSTLRPTIKPGTPYAIAIVNPDKTLGALAMDKVFGTYIGEYPYLLITEYSNVQPPVCIRQFGITEVSA